MKRVLWNHEKNSYEEGPFQDPFSVTFKTHYTHRVSSLEKLSLLGLPR